MGRKSQELQRPEEESNDPESQEFRERMSDISHQSSISFLGTICTLVVGYLFRVYLARTLGAKLLGWNALGIGVYAICRLIGDLGLPYAADRYAALYSSTRQSARLWTFFWRALLISLLGACALCVAVIVGRGTIATHYFHDPSFSRYLPFYAILIPVGAANSFLLQCLTGLKKVNRRTVISHFIALPFMIVISVIALKSGLSLRGYVSAQIMGEMLSVVLAMWAILRSAGTTLLRINVYPLNLRPEEWWFALSLLAISSMEFMSSGADRVILGHFVVAKQIGVYAVASSAAALCPLVLQSINTIFGPTIADLHAKGKQKLLLRLYQTITKWVIAMTLPLIFVLIVFSRVIMGIFGVEFQEGSTVLAILSLGQLINVGTGSVGSLLYMSGHQKRMIPIQLAVAFSVLVANIALIPLLGILGAAIVASLATAVTNLWFLDVVRKRMSLFPYTRSYLKLILPSILTVISLRIVIVNFSTGFPPMVLLITVLVMGYGLFFLTFLLLGLNRDDRIVLKIMQGRLQSFISARPSTA